MRTKRTRHERRTRSRHLMSAANRPSADYNSPLVPAPAAAFPLSSLIPYPSSQPSAMTDSSQVVDAATHRKLAVALFNNVWGLMEKPNRTLAESDAMLHAAHASRWHWEQCGTAVNL